MKRKVFMAVLLAVLFVLAGTGCREITAAAGLKEGKNPAASGTQNEQEPLRICLDLAYLGMGNESPDYSYENAVEAAAQGLMLKVAEKGGPSDVEIEVIPRDEAARKSTLTKLRTEIMSGEGPDVFIMGCAGGPFGSDGDALFLIPEKAMQNGLFLPLDSYMENHTQFTEWDKLQQTVLKAGRTEEGQLLIPITYTMPVTFYRAAELEAAPGAETTWQDMVKDKTGVLSSAACWYNMNDELLHMRGNYIEYTFGSLADYEAEELMFTEEELARRIEEIQQLNAECEQGAFAGVPAHYKTCLSVDFNNETGSNAAFLMSTLTGEELFSGIKPTDEQVMIPIYSDDGGAAATVMCYAAVNINTRRPQDAFTVIDVLMDRETQQKSVLYENWFTQLYGIPMHEDLLQPKFPAMYTANGKMWYLREENYAELCRLRDQITHARFRGGLDIELNDAYHAYAEAVRTGEGSSEEIIAEYYKRMKRVLSE